MKYKRYTEIKHNRTFSDCRGGGVECLRCKRWEYCKTITRDLYKFRRLFLNYRADALKYRALLKQANGTRDGNRKTARPLVVVISRPNKCN